MKKMTDKERGILLEGLSKDAQVLKNASVPDEYWEKEAKQTQEIINENRKLAESVTMSYEKFYQPFTL